MHVCSVAQWCPIPCDPMDCSPPGVGCHFLLPGIYLPDPGIKPSPPAFAGGFFTNEPPGKPK